MIHFTVEDTDFPALSVKDDSYLDAVSEAVKVWMPRVAASHGKKLGEINYILCSDKRILEVNLEFLQHDYYTDIITFDYTQGDRVSGDIYISLDTVRSNAEMLSLPFHEELCRVLAHGVLHLCGFKDKTPEDAQNMRKQEQLALELRPETLLDTLS